MEHEDQYAPIYADFLNSLSSQIAELNLFTHFFQIAHDTLQVSASRSSDLENFGSSISHMRVESGNAKAAVYLINRSELPRSFILPKLPFMHFENELLRFYFSAESGSLEIFDRINTVFYVLASNLAEFITIHSSSNLYYLKPILNNLGYVNMHGAVLGRNNRGIFLTNKGGSGKSTLMAYCISRGLNTLGDDFLTMRPEEMTRFFSLYRQFKIGKTSPALTAASARFPQLGEVDGKQVFAIDESNSEIFKSEMHISEILIPVIGSELKISKISKAEAMQRVLASTLFLNWTIEKAIATVSALLDSVPFHLLEVTPDLESAYQFLESRVSQ